MSQLFLNMIRRGETAEIASALQENPALARSRDAQGVSALLWSIYTRQPLIRDALRAQLSGLDIHEAAALGDCDRLHALIAEDASLARAVSPDGWPPLHLAAAFATPQAVALLLEHGAHVHQFSHNPMRNQALHACIALGGPVESITLLLEAGAAVNATQAAGFTPLHQAAAAGNSAVVTLLLEHGADPTACCDQGKTPPAYARERGHHDLATHLDNHAAAKRGVSLSPEF
jgi:ankyrin repeat protein